MGASETAKWALVSPGYGRKDSLPSRVSERLKDSLPSRVSERLKNFILGNEPSRMLDQITEYIESLGGEGDTVIRAP
jgi:hypothetical protein